MMMLLTLVLSLLLSAYDYSRRIGRTVFYELSKAKMW